MSNSFVQTVATVKRGQKLSSLLSDQDKQLLRDKYPVSLLIADRLTVFKVVDNSMVLLDLNWVADNINENQYQEPDQLYFDLDTYSCNMDHLIRVDWADMVEQALETYTQWQEDRTNEDSPEAVDEFRNMQVFSSIATGESDAHTVDGKMSAMAMRCLILTFITVAEMTKMMSSPEALNVINECFEQANAEPVVNSVRSEADWEF